MSERLKEFVRRILYGVCVYLALDSLTAKDGTLWFRFLNWVYEGEGERQFESWFPEDK